MEKCPKKSSPVMSLNHSKTWPVTTMAVVQLRVNPRGEDFEIIENGQFEDEKAPQVFEKPAKDPGVVPLLEKHVQVFAKMSSRPRTTIRTDTVSTILDPADFDSERNDNEEASLKSPTFPCDENIQKFHVLALTRIEETGVDDTETGENGEGSLRRGDHPGSVGRRPSIKVDNWDFIYTERTPEAQNRCPVHHFSLSSPNGRIGTKDSLLPPELPLDARKTTTLRRHYYPEGGWGWVVVTCAVLVHVLNHGVQLAYSQLVQPGAEKFRTDKVHFAGMDD